MAKVIQSPEEHLLARGWIRVSPEDAPSPKKIWRDPASTGKPVTRVTSTQSFDGGRIKRPVSQTFHPTAMWHYTTRQAEDLQRERDGKPALDRD